MDKCINVSSYNQISIEKSYQQLALEEEKGAFSPLNMKKDDTAVSEHRGTFPSRPRCGPLPCCLWCSCAHELAACLSVGVQANTGSSGEGARHHLGFPGENSQRVQAVATQRL